MAQDGTPLFCDREGGAVQHLHNTTRMIYSFALARDLGVAGADKIINHGMDFLWSRHRDTKCGGYFWGVDDANATDPKKQAYGHAFVLLAASSAKVVGHPDAEASNAAGDRGARDRRDERAQAAGAGRRAGDGALSRL